MTVGFMTLGCKVNQYDTQGLEELFISRGFEIVDFDVCDIAVVNTCTVTSIADKKSRQAISRAIRRGAKVIACGCLAQSDAKTLLDMGVYAAVGTKNRAQVVDIALNGRDGGAIDDESADTFEELPISQTSRREAYIKIQDGCDNFCAYCKIPYVRGRSRSRDYALVMEEVKRLSHKETLVLTGIHIDDYSFDGKTLIDVLEEVTRIAQHSKIRLGSLHPKCFTKEFLERGSQLENLIPSFHISLQSGCDGVLSRMNRKYTTEEYFTCLENIRKYFKNPAITTDIIAGFSGETLEEHQQTLAFVKKCGFASVHVFPYSKRKGTASETMPDTITNAEKNRRVNEIIALFTNLT